MTDQAKIREAQIKLTADYINRLAVNFFAVGVITPVAAVLFEFAPITASAWKIGFISLCFLVTSFGLHYLARYQLRRL